MERREEMDEERNGDSGTREEEIREEIPIDLNILFSGHRRDLNRLFPDGDGIIGVTQQLGKFCPAAFGLVGRKWVNRFPNRQMMYPKYIHFCSDSELWRYSRGIKRFHLSKAAVYHNRPFDDCKKLAQTTLTRDRRIWFPRRDAGKFWPKFK